MPPRAWGHRSLSILCALAVAVPAAAQVPTFGASAEAITVDVVVLDARGQPVTDLQRGDFVLSEDGRPQPIVGFETRVLARDAAGAEEPPPAAASNEHLAAPGGRTLAFLVDDAGIEPLHMAQASQAIARWLGEGADRRDVVTLVSSSGDAWWSDTVGRGRDDLLAVLARMKGKKAPAATVDFMSDFEASNIDGRGAPLGPGGYVERVVDRWLRSGACISPPSNPEAARQTCASQVVAEARGISAQARGRGKNLLSLVEQLSSGLSGARGRKSVIVLSEGLLRDTDRHAYERAVDASRRGNTAVSFVDVRGLIGAPAFSAGQRTQPTPADVGAVTLERTVLETEGGEALAEATGGAMVRNTNDVAGRVRALADEAAAYYLLGYQSDRPRDGKWHPLTVKVSRPGLTVRARRGFFATAAAPALTAEKGPDRKDRPKDGSLPARAMDSALAVGGDRDQIPLRAAAHVLETDATGTARVLVALEVDTGGLGFTGTGAERAARLDVTVLGVSRDQAKAVPVDTQVTLGADGRPEGGWASFSRELRLPPGPAQIRTLVRDTASGRSGLVTQRLDIPSAARPYISTPMLSDRAPAPGAGDQPVGIAAHRTFAARGQLFCTYEVYPGRQPAGLPHVQGSFRVEDAQGEVVASAPPTPIAVTKDARFVRRVALSLDGLEPGRYRLVVEAVDEAAGLDVEAHEVFFIEKGASAAAQED